MSTTDGAGFEVLWPGLRVAGWAVVVADVNGDVASAIFGVVPIDEGPSQVARDGEDFAILMLSRNALLGGRITVHVDCEGTLGCAYALPSSDWSKEQRAHWWCEINDRLELATFEKVDSHLPYSAVREGRTTHRDWNGNRQADTLAKQGAEPFRTNDDDLLLVQGLHEMAKRVARYAGLQQASLSHAEVRDHLGHEWMSRVVLEAIPGFPIPSCCSNDTPEGDETGGQVEGDPASSQFVSGGLPPDEYVPDPWKVRGHCIQQAEVLDKEKNQVDSLIFCTQCGSTASFSNRAKIPLSRCQLLGNCNGKAVTGRKNLNRLERGDHPSPSVSHKVRIAGGLGLRAKELWGSFLFPPSEGRPPGKQKETSSPSPLPRPPPVDFTRGMALFGLTPSEARDLGSSVREEASRRRVSEQEVLPDGP